jgi:hypothetical protein
VKNPQDLNRTCSNPVRDDVWRVGNYQLAGSEYPACATRCRVLGETIDSSGDRIDSTVSGRRIVAGYVLSLGIQVRQGGSEPLNAHAPTIS